MSCSKPFERLVAGDGDRVSGRVDQERPAPGAVDVAEPGAAKWEVSAACSSEPSRQLIWKDRPSSVFFTGPAPVRSGVIPEGADGGPDEAASTTNQADIRGLPEAEPHDRGSSGAASV